MLEQLYYLVKLLRAYLDKELLGDFLSTLYSCFFFAVIFFAFSTLLF